MNLDDLSTQLLFTTVPIWVQTTDRGTSSATAFIYMLPIPGKSEQSIPLLVTNHHVVQGGTRGLIELVERDGNVPVLDRRVRVELSAEQMLKHVSAELDIVLIPLGPVLNQLSDSGRPPFFRATTSDMIPSSEALSGLAAIEEVVFIGYPSGLRDEKNAMPLIRRGITSTPVWSDFQGKACFLIDAGVFPGSSGSPVFIYNQGAYTTNGGLAIGSRLLFLGMLSQAMIRTVTNVQTFLGLGQVLRSAAIRDFAEREMRPYLAAV